MQQPQDALLRDTWWSAAIAATGATTGIATVHLASSLPTAVMQRPDLGERSLLPRFHKAPEMPSCKGNAAVKPCHCVKHNRVTKKSPVPDVVPPTARSPEDDDALVAVVGDCRVTSPPGAIPVAVPVGSLRVSI